MYNLSANTEMMIGQADSYVPADIRRNSLAIVDAVNYQQLASGVRRDPRPIPVGLWWSKWYWDIFYSENFDRSIRIISHIFFSNS